MSDFDYGTIEIRYNSENYGPFNFDFEDMAPPGTTIFGVSVKSYFGNVKVGDLLSSQTETTSDLIDTGLIGINGDYTVDVYFNYPTVAYEGNHTVFFEITWDNTAVHAYTFYKVLVV
jgi:hypothetical protein